MIKETIILCLQTIRKSDTNEDRLTELMCNVFEDFQGISRQHVRDVKHNIAVICSLFPENQRDRIRDEVEEFLYVSESYDYESFVNNLIFESKEK